VEERLMIEIGIYDRGKVAAFRRLVQAVTGVLGESACKRTRIMFDSRSMVFNQMDADHLKLLSVTVPAERAFDHYRCDNFALVTLDLLSVKALLRRMSSGDSLFLSTCAQKDGEELLSATTIPPKKSKEPAQLLNLRVQINLSCDTNWADDSVYTRGGGFVEITQRRLGNLALAIRDMRSFLASFELSQGALKVTASPHPGDLTTTLAGYSMIFGDPDEEEEGPDVCVSMRSSHVATINEVARTLRCASVRLSLAQSAPIKATMTSPFDVEVEIYVAPVFLEEEEDEGPAHQPSASSSSSSPSSEEDAPRARLLKRMRKK
jgi:hypothetical protein